MVRLTLVTRVADGLPLCESLDADASGEVEAYKQQAKVSRRGLRRRRGGAGAARAPQGAAGAPPPATAARRHGSAGGSGPPALLRLPPQRQGRGRGAKPPGPRLAGALTAAAAPAAPDQVMVKKMSTSKLPNRMTYESGGSCFHYTVERGVCFLTLADRGYPKKLAYQYLEEIQNEFLSLYSGEIDSIARPYACIKFDRFIQKTKKLYLDTRTQVSRGRARGATAGGLGPG